jgi:hypothetical protein
MTYQEKVTYITQKCIEATGNPNPQLQDILFTANDLGENFYVSSFGEVWSTGYEGRYQYDLMRNLDEQEEKTLDFFIVLFNNL